MFEQEPDAFLIMKQAVRFHEFEKQMKEGMGLGDSIGLGSLLKDILEKVKGMKDGEI